MKISAIKPWLMSRTQAAQAAGAATIARRKLDWRRMAHHSSRVGLYSFSMVGLLLVLAAAALWAKPDWRSELAARVSPLLEAAAGVHPQNGLEQPAHPIASDPNLMIQVAQHVPSAAVLAAYIPAQRIAADAKDAKALLSAREQTLVADYLARRYRVAADVTSNLVKAAYGTGKEVGLDPLLLLAVMAIESGFNPYAESNVGAQGLMQVMSKVHLDKLNYFGGPQAALHPLANIKVGALILKECIARGGSLAAGLRQYNGSTGAGDGGYSAKVLAERNRLRSVAMGRKVSPYAPQRQVLVSAKAKPAANKPGGADANGAQPVAGTLSTVSTTGDAA